jgi:VIT1/CCC1 family predicted Fe2+/Mn2+ transporter
MTIDTASSQTLEHSHTPAAIQQRLSAGPQHSYLRDWVYGGIDGAVTTFAVVSGAVGGALGHEVILILGAANLIADGFSMAASNFSGTRAEAEELRRIWQIEARHIEVAPEGEREEVRQIYQAKGFEGVELDRAVAVITSDRDRWIETMIQDEYGMAKEVRSPLRAALSTFAAFGVCGAVPLAPYLLHLSHAFELSIVLTVVTFFLVGAAKSMWLTSPWWRSAVETAVLGSAAAGLSYLIAGLVRQFFGA